MANLHSSQPIMSAGALTGERVRNTAGEDLGRIEDFVLDLDVGRVRYAVLSFGGVLGIGEKRFAIPLEALTMDPDNECLVLDIDRERLKQAPGFHKDNLPDFADPQFGQHVYQYYGRTPYWRS